MDNRKGQPLLIIALAVAVLIGLSLCPWSKWTGGTIKDFNLLSDLFPSSETDDAPAQGAEIIDPDLELVLQQEKEKSTSPLSASVAPQPAEEAAPAKQAPAKAPRNTQGEVLIEDYTPDCGLAKVRSALAGASGRPMRIAIVGDSYIEGDIFAQDIRRLLQQQYGGRGVGYVPAHSEVSGFRRSIIHSSSGWTQHDSRKTKSNPYFPLSGEYFTGNAGATITYKADKSEATRQAWNLSQILFIAPKRGTIKMEIDGESREFPVEASEAVQALQLPGETKTLKITNGVPGLVMLGAWLGDTTGVQVDCMSVRGDSGIGHRNLGADLAEGMRRAVDYDLIILEYGINALSSSQKEYSSYGRLMGKVVDQVRKCYPNAQILLMGIGDRGQKINGEVHSLPTAPAMIDAQRQTARNAGVLFWDTREAMGGEDAIVDWRADKLVNADYIHLNAKGGAELASRLVKSLTATE